MEDFQPWPHRYHRLIVHFSPPHLSAPRSSSLSSSPLSSDVTTAVATMHVLQTPALCPTPPHRLGRFNAKQPRKKVSFILSAASPTVAAPKREKDPKKRVVITGMGLVSVFGNDVDAYYEKLLAGESGISPIDRFDASKFPTRFGGQIRGFDSQGYIDGKNDRRLDDCLRYCIVAGKKALEDADLGGADIPKVDMLNVHFILDLLNLMEW